MEFVFYRIENQSRPMHFVRLRGHKVYFVAAQNEVALSYHRVRGLYFLSVAFVAILVGFCWRNTRPGSYD